MGLNATLFLAKSAGTNGLGGCPDLRRFADHSGGTVADSHGLPRIPNLLNVEWQSMLRDDRCQLGASGPEVTTRVDAVLPHTNATVSDVHLVFTFAMVLGFRDTRVVFVSCPFANAF